MPTAFGKLSSQAEQLKETVSFFRVDQLTNTRKSTRYKTTNTSYQHSYSKASYSTKKAPGKVLIHMHDELDNEFESY